MRRFAAIVERTSRAHVVDEALVHAVIQEGLRHARARGEPQALRLRAFRERAAFTGP